MQSNVSTRHPAGLWVLFTTEMWERFCYYGMRAFLVLYLISKASADNPGLGWTEKEAYNLYGIFTGLVYLMPLFGGWVADRFIGPHRSVFWGGVIMAIGEFTLASVEFLRKGGGIPVNLQEDPFAVCVFFLGLTLMIIGTGFFKPCISVMVGQLYEKDDPRRDGAFTIFYMGINLGAFLAPLIAGAIAEKIGWSYGFMTAGFGMIFGLVTYSTFRPFYLAHIGLPPQRVDENAQNLTEEQKEAIRAAEYERTRPLTKVDYDRIFVIGILVFFTIAFWTAFEQAGSSMNIFAKNETDRRVSETFLSVLPKGPLLINEPTHISGRMEAMQEAAQGQEIITFPATWYQSVNALGIVVFAPIFAFMWVFLAARNIQPSTPVKFGIGLLLLSTSFVVMIPGAIESHRTSGLAAPYWLVFSYLLATWGELCLSPVGLSMVTKLSPARFGSLMMGVWFLSSACANYLSGFLAALFSRNEDGTSSLNLLYGQDGGMADFFLIMAIIPAAAGIIVLVISPILKRMMHGIH